MFLQKPSDCPATAMCDDCKGEFDFFATRPVSIVAGFRADALVRLCDRCRNASRNDMCYEDAADTFFTGIDPTSFEVDGMTVVGVVGRIKRFYANTYVVVDGYPKYSGIRPEELRPLDEVSEQLLVVANEITALYEARRR